MSTVPGGVTEAAERVLGHATAAPPRLGRTRLVCIDGPAGAGKTTLAAEVSQRAAATGTTRVVHMDDLYEGWDGLGSVGGRVADLLAPLAEGEPGAYRRYDWVAGAFAETHQVEPVDLLVLEGVGSGDAAWAAYVTTLVWVDAPTDLRLRRGLERDGEAALPHWRTWQEAEAAHFARDRTRARAQLLVDGGTSAK